MNGGLHRAWSLHMGSTGAWHHRRPLTGLCPAHARRTTPPPRPATFSRTTRPGSSPTYPRTSCPENASTTSLMFLHSRPFPPAFSLSALGQDSHLCLSGQQPPPPGCPSWPRLGLPSVARVLVSQELALAVARYSVSPLTSLRRESACERSQSVPVTWGRDRGRCQPSGAVANGVAGSRAGCPRVEFAWCSNYIRWLKEPDSCRGLSVLWTAVEPVPHHQSHRCVGREGWGGSRDLPATACFAQAPEPKRLKTTSPSG